MKFMICVSTLLLSLVSFSATRLQFFLGDRNAMAILTPTDAFGNSDSDSSDLYQTMNVPEQDTMLGRGKSITSSERDFNLVCGEYKSQCQFILNKSQNVKISVAMKTMSFRLTGEQAAALSGLFKLNSEGEAYFQTTDKLLRLKGTATEFVLEAAFN